MMIIIRFFLGKVMPLFSAIVLAALIVFVSGCGTRQDVAVYSQDETVPRFLKILPLEDGGFRLVSVSPFGGGADTLRVERPLRSIVAMSTSHVGFLCAIGCDSVVSGVSGLDYACAPSIAARAASGLVREVGFEAAPDYEAILALKPDVVLTYSVSAAESSFAAKLESLGLRVFPVHEHLEQMPLARASYVRLFGALTGRMAEADSVFEAVCQRYRDLRDAVAGGRRKVLLNIPYNDQWFVPARDNYLSNLVADAGGEVLGAEKGNGRSSCISLERAWSLSKEADCWLNLGWCRSLKDLFSVNPAFEDFYGNVLLNAGNRGVEGPVAWNDNLSLSPKGGNDIWERGVVHPELVLEDLIRILHPGSASVAVTGADSTLHQPQFHFYRPVD